jgi:uncharacterized protein YlbG (UPF0298 family)
MPIISIRISDEEKRKLQKYGRLSQVIREAIKFYIDSKSTRRTLKKLKELQEKYEIKTSMEEDLELIKEDRGR